MPSLACPGDRGVRELFGALASTHGCATVRTPIHAVVSHGVPSSSCKCTFLALAEPAAPGQQRHRGSVCLGEDLYGRRRSGRDPDGRQWCPLERGFVSTCGRRHGTSVSFGDRLL